MPLSAFHISALPHRWSDLLCHFFYLFGESLPSQSIPLTGSFSMDNQEGDGKSHQDTENFSPLNLYFMTYQLIYTHAHTHSYFCTSTHLIQESIIVIRSFIIYFLLETKSVLLTLAYEKYSYP